MIKLIYALLLSLGLFACDTISDFDKPNPGSRTYQWSVDAINTDTIYNGFSGIGAVWGSSPNDLWIVHGSAGELWRKEGQTWRKAATPFEFKPVSGYYFGNNQFLLVSKENTSCFYNGSSFEEVKHIDNSGLQNIVINDVFAISPTEIYAVGSHDVESFQRSLMMRYDGSTWSVIKTDSLGNFNKIAKGYNTNFFIEFNPLGKYHRILEWDGKNFKLFAVDYIDFALIGQSIYFIESGIYYKYDNGKRYRWKDFEMIDNSKIYGRNECDIFSGDWNGIVHYNGTDEAYIYLMDYMTLYDCYLSDSEVYFLVYDYNTSRLKVICGVYK